MLIYTPVGCKAEEMTWLAKPLQWAEEIPAPFLGDLRWSQLEETFQQLPEGFWKWHWQCSVCMEVREGGRTNSLHSSIEQLGCFEGCSVDSLGFESSVCRSVCVGRPCFSKRLAPLGCAAYPVAWKRHSAGRSARGRKIKWVVFPFVSSHSLVLLHAEQAELRSCEWGVVVLSTNCTRVFIIPNQRNRQKFIYVRRRMRSKTFSLVSTSKYAQLGCGF